MRKSDKIYLITTFAIIIPIFILLMIFDWQISAELIPKQVNWFTVGFDAYGQSIAVIPSFLILIFSINYFLIRTNNSRTNRLSWLVLWTILMNGVVYYFLIKKTLSTNAAFFQASQSSLYKSAALIINIVMTVIEFSFVCYLTLSPFMSSNEMGRLLFQRTWTAFIFVILMLVTCEVLKNFFGRPRPREIVDAFYQKNHFHYALEPCFQDYRSKSFPSGHTVSSVLMLSTLFYVPKKSKGAFYTLLAFNVVTIGCTGLARVMIHAHWSTDVTFSMFLGAMYYFASPKIVKKMKGWK
jgi:membrane-associated phospholipid phosphatase